MFRDLPRSALAILLVGLASSAASCGGAQGGAGPTGAGQDLVLTYFSENSTDTVALNRTLEFVFSEDLDPSTCTPASVQVREGPAYGITPPGTLRVVGNRMYFDPRIPNLCDLSDSGFKPSTTYSITLVGHPEEFSIRNTRGQPLGQTETFHFTTRGDADPLRYDDQVPGSGPEVLLASPDNGDAAVDVLPGNAIVLTVSENLDPCTVSDANVRLDMYERGDKDTFVSGAPSGNASGFDPYYDQSPDVTSWGGSATAVLPVQRIPVSVLLDQTVTSTQIRVVPTFGKFPENALLVLRVTADLLDFSGSGFEAFTMAFTTENKTGEQNDTYTVENEGETPYLPQQTTAEVNTQRSLSKAQGFLVFSGDGDNGSSLLTPSAPEVPPACTAPRDINDGTPDEFNAVSNMVLDTGATENTCPNRVDGSTAVVYEFSKFTIASGATVTVTGANALIILVAGPVKIATGGSLLLKGGNGAQGIGSTTYGGPWLTGVAGGVGVAGGGDGGASVDALASQGGQSGGSWPMPAPYAVPDLNSYGEDGWPGVGSPGFGAAGGLGAGEGNAAVWYGNNNPNAGGTTSCGGGGGGGGHAAAGGAGGSSTDPAGNGAFSAPARGQGGAPYLQSDPSMLLPQAGSGGGAGGYHAMPGLRLSLFNRYDGAQATGGGGGGGGGFLDITSSSDIVVNGTIDASGGRGGNGNSSYFCDTGGSGGGGGGSGGGIRLLTPANIDISGATITTAGGQGGIGGSGQTCPNYGTNGARNDGGSGAHGRIVFEDSDGVISGQAGATLVPMEPQQGFYRGKFNLGRFVGGGGRAVAVSDLFLAGAFDPEFQNPQQSYGGGTADFIAGIPAAAAAPGTVQILVEAQGYQMLPNGDPELSTPTGWRTVGYFMATGNPNQPQWVLGQVPLADRPSDNIFPFGISNLDGHEYIQIRLTFILGPDVELSDPGPFIDRWVIRFTHEH